MKQLMLGTVFGRIALNIRNGLDILKFAYTKPESVGMLINDQLASNLVVKLCNPNKVFIDIGAHIGSITSAVIDHSTSIKVIAIEAIPEKAKNLRQKFPSVEVHECALGNSEGEVSFYINTKQSGYSSLARPSPNKKENIIEIKVPIKKLDNVISIDNIDVIKIDVEGAELGVLIGSENIITTNRPTIMFESGPPKEDGLGHSKEDIWQWLDEHRYEILIPNRIAHNGPKLSKEGFIECHYYPRRTTNFFAIPIERRVAIRDLAREVLNIHP